MKKPTKKTEKNVEMQSPWVTYYNKINALFGSDPEIEVNLDTTDSANPKITLYVDNTVKANSINMLLKSEVDMGNIKLTVSAVCPNNKVSSAKAGAAIIESAFKNNPIFKEAVTVETLIGNISYAIFQKEVIQFYNDDLTDAWGNFNGLAEDIMREVIDDKNTAIATVNFCTDGEVKK